MDITKKHPKAALGEQPEWGGLEECLEIPDPKEFIQELIESDLAESLINRGYALIPLDEDLKKVYADFALSLKAFCDQDISEKVKFATLMDNSKYTPNQFHGYSRMEGLKEQYMIRSSGKGANLILPGSYHGSPHFGETALRLYQHLDNTCRKALYCVAERLVIPYANVDRIIDEVDQHDGLVTVHPSKDGDICYTTYTHPGYISSSLLDVFHYGNTFAKEDRSFEKFKNNHLSHSDSGILTLVPVADVPGLDVYDQKLEAWIALEQMVHANTPDHRKYGTIFWGDSFEYLSKYILKACMHRVSKCESERYSIVFKMRTKPTATAPRYQEDYGLAVLQQRSLDRNKNQQNFKTALIVGSLAWASLILYQILKTK